MSPTDTLPTCAESYALRASRFQFIIEQPNTLEVLCQRVAEGETVKEIAKAWDVPHGRLSAWLLADADRCAQYFRAQQVHAHTLVEEAVGIADNIEGDVKRDKLRIETRFQVAGYHAKDRYGAQEKTGGGTKVNVIVQRSQEPRALDAPHTERHTETRTELNEEVQDAGQR